MSTQTDAERLISKHLRKFPIRVEASPEGRRRYVFRDGKVATGRVVGIANGFLRVLVDGNKKPTIFHGSFWKGQK